MSNGFEWELCEWGDGTIRLTYWDSLTAQDIVYVLNDDGTVERSEWVYNGDDDESGHEVMTRVNLSLALRAFISNRE